MFSEWDCSSYEAELVPGDTLLLFTDGITEAMSKDGQEFGEEGLIEVVRAECHLSVERLLERILEKVSTFSSREQQDDVTLVVARCRFAAE